MNQEAAKAVVDEKMEQQKKRRSRMRQASHAIAQNQVIRDQMRRVSEMTKSAEKQLAIEKTNARNEELIRYKDDQEGRRQV